MQTQEDTTCLICFDDYLEESNDWLVRSSNCECQKHYHLKCFINWYKDNKECPICHKELRDNNLQALIYHNKKWKILPFDYILKIFKYENFNTIIDIDEDETDREKSKDFNMFFLLYLCIAMLVSFIIILLIILYL